MVQFPEPLTLLFFALSLQVSLDLGGHNASNIMNLKKNAFSANRDITKFEQVNYQALQAIQ